MHLNRIRSLLPSFSLGRTSKAADEESIKCSTIRGHSHSGFPSSILSARPETTVGKRILFSPSHPVSRRRWKFIGQQLNHIPSLVLLNLLWIQAWRADQLILLRNTSRPLNLNEPTTRVNYLLQSYTFPRALLVTLLPNPFFVPLSTLCWSGPPSPHESFLAFPACILGHPSGSLEVDQRDRCMTNRRWD